MLTKIRAKLRAFSSRAEVTIAAKMAIAAALSYLAGHLINMLIEHPSTVVSGLWVVMASIVVMQSRLGGTYKAVWSRFLGILIGSLAGGIFIYFFGESWLSILVGVFITVSLCSLLNLKDSVRIAGLSTAMIIILGASKPDVNPWEFTFFRFLDSCTGMVVSLSVAYFLWPEKAIENMRQTTTKLLNELIHYYSSAATLDKKTDTVKRSLAALHGDIIELIEENRTYRDESEIELFDREHLHEQWKLFILHLEALFEMIGTLGKLEPSSVGLMIDDGLAKAIDKVIQDTEIIMQNTEKDISNTNIERQTHDLPDSLKLMNEELLRFRQTRTTRKFNLDEVENYFVYFYSLKTIGEQVLKIEAIAKNM